MLKRTIKMFDNNMFKHYVRFFLTLPTSILHVRNQLVKMRNFNGINV